MILRHLTQRRLRSALTVPGIALGIAAIVVPTAVAGGLSSGFGDVFGGSKHDELVDETHVKQLDALRPTPLGRLLFGDRPVAGSSLAGSSLADASLPPAQRFG